MTREEKKAIYMQAIREYLNAEEKDQSLTKFADKYGLKRQTMSKYMKEMGYEIINHQNKCRIDETVFDEIDTEEKAYWLGFLMADGNIGNNEHKLEMNLAAKDWEHMKKFQDFLHYTNPEVRIREQYGRGTEQCRFSIRNLHIWSALNNKGCTPKKSLTLVFPDLSIFKTQNLVRHFIRGYWDGDGSLGIYPVNGNPDRLIEEVSVVGTESFLTSVACILGHPNIKPYSKGEYNKAFKLSFSSLTARKIMRYLYEGATIYLDRKYEIYKKSCQLEEESSRKKSSKIGEDCDVNTEVN